MDLRRPDELVGRHVMDFHEIVRGSVDYYVDRFGPLPHYSSDLAAAWQVVEKMKEDGWHYYVGSALTDDHYARFHEFLNDDGDEGSAAASTAPLAICLAALRAKGVEVPAE